MSKALKIQVLAFENKDEVNVLLRGLNTVIIDDNYFSDSTIKTAKEIRDELIKIVTIFEATNNN